MNRALAELARAAGVEAHYTDFYGERREATEETIVRILEAMGYPCSSPSQAQSTLAQVLEDERRGHAVYVLHEGSAAESALTSEDGRTVRPGEPLAHGYYDLDSPQGHARVIAVPQQAYLPQALQDGKLWGIAAQLYSLRSERNWGIGDFGDLAELARAAGGAGAAALALNPLHELHLTNASSASPYSPASRLHLNALYVDVPAAAAYLGLPLAPAPERNAEIERLRASALVEYVPVARLKLQALRELHARFAERAGERLEEFTAFREAGGERLRALALYEALMEYFTAREPRTYGWMQWPREYHDVRGAAAAQFAAEHRREVAFFEFAQWLADVQLREAARAAAHMPIGLYRDLAVGVDASSADVWADPGAYCTQLCVGAPPDPLNAAGQNWSLPPFNPRVLRERAYAPYIELLRANMQHAGALRIDHVMGLMRLFCIPRGAAAAEGTYVNYRFDEMLGVLALESRRNRCMIVGEDLGTVPPGFRERMERVRIFGCRLMYFERDASGEFADPARYTADAVASTGTHDLPPLAGFWERADDATRGALVRMLERYGDLGKEGASDLFPIVLAAYRSLGRSAARLLLLQLEDVLMQREQVNTPGTFDEVPNWRHKLARTIAEIARDPRFTALTGGLRETRAEEVHA